MTKVVLAPEAMADAAGIWAYIAKDNEAAADRVIERFDVLFQGLALQPSLGKGVEELAPNLRLLPAGSYLIFYRPKAEVIEIVRILHGARDITAEFFRD